MVILSGNLDEDAYKQSLEQVETLIKAKKGTVTDLDEWGKRKLAYSILKQDFGYYLVFRFTANEASVPKSIDDSLKIQDSVLRAMITIASTKKRPEPAEKKTTTEEVTNA
jgi:small subunit ribosomal protein S6